MIRRLLVANRGEIASRVFRTCRGLGIETVAVHSDADAELPYVAHADLAVRLPGNAPAETYLDVEKLLGAARQAHADAIHPGYGFLSENAGFARAVVEAGLTWVGPDPESIEAMGSKIEAKRLMRAARVPVLEAPESPTPADLPLLIKASAGGGGRGMRVVRDLADLPGEVAAAEAEAASALGDGTVFVEPYVERGRHVEVQVLFDRHGTGLAVGDRDCSLQRRHQKVVEEAPAPDLSDEVRAGLHTAALEAGASTAYVGAGTVEFLYDPETERFFFLEMNTRLQVEHPVTEAVQGVDLVALQLAVAEGERLDPELLSAPDGHAIEVRLYAEDPAADYRPQSGTLTSFEIPVEPGIRVDAGYRTGSRVSTYYDAMLAKVVCHAPTRTGAARQLAGVLARARLHGVRTNRDQLVAVLRDPTFLDEQISTAFLTEHPPPDDPSVINGRVIVAAHAASAVRALTSAQRRTVQRGMPPAWRNVVSQPQRDAWRLGDEDIEVAWMAARGGGIGFPEADVEILAVHGDRVRIRFEDDVASCRVTLGELDAVADVDGIDGHLRLELVPRFRDPADQVASGSLLAPMPGSVVDVPVEVGDHVEAGAPVVVLEAMKMQHTVRAPGAGTVARLDVRPGAQVAAGEVLAVVEDATQTATQERHA